MTSDTRTPEQRVLADTMLNGGGTYRADTLSPYRPTDGYAVAVGGVELRLDRESPLHAEELAIILRDLAAEHGTTYVGTWVDEQVLYLDAVFVCWDGQSAYRMALAHNQKAVFDFSTGESIRPGQISFDQ